MTASMEDAAATLAAAAVAANAAEQQGQFDTNAHSTSSTADWSRVSSPLPSTPAVPSAASGLRALVDLKGLARPPPFDGTEERWED